MASEAESEEQLGEHAPAGVQALEVDKKGNLARWRDMSKPDRSAQEEEITPGPEATQRTTSRPGACGVTESGESSGDTDTSQAA